VEGLDEGLSAVQWARAHSPVADVWSAREETVGWQRRRASVDNKVCVDDELFERRPALIAEGQQLGQRPTCQEVVSAKISSVAGVGALLLHSASAGEPLQVRRSDDPRGPGHRAWPPTPATSWRAGEVGLCGGAADPPGSGVRRRRLRKTPQGARRREAPTQGWRAPWLSRAVRGKAVRAGPRQVAGFGGACPRRCNDCAPTG
jgi:hypothetical protein